LHKRFKGNLFFFGSINKKKDRRAQVYATDEKEGKNWAAYGFY